MKTIKPSEQESNVDFYLGLLRRIIKKWYLFAFSFILFFGIGYYIVKSSDQIFENQIVLLIQASNKTNNTRAMGNLDQLQMFSVQSELEDELGIISSYPVVFEAVKALNLNVSYYIDQGLIQPEIYKDSPIQVYFNIENPQPVNVFFELTKITKSSFNLHVKSEEPVALYDYLNDSIISYLDGLNINKQFNFGDEIKIGNTGFRIILNKNFNADFLHNKALYFNFNNMEDLAIAFQGSISVEKVSTQSSLVNVSMIGSNSVLITDFLNSLSTVYLNRNLEKKNKIADKTIDFIDRQIDGIADSLGLTANQLKDFRVKNNVMDINYLSQSVYEQMRLLENQRAELLVASKYYDYIKEYFENNKDLTDLLAPSAMGVNDPQLQNLIVQLTEKNSQRAYQLDSKSEKNPIINVLNAEINNLKKTILENIDYIVYTSNITINDINERIAKLNGQVKNLPSIEKELKNIEREFHVNDAIYTFLLSTRAEAEIARASNSPDYEVIAPAKYINSTMVGPKKKLIYFSSILLGMMTPIGLLILTSFFKNSLDDRREIEKIANLPLLGTVARNTNQTYLPIYEYPKSLIAESFRSIRTGMQFFQKGKPKQKILITSSMSGDGKSFIAINLATAYANSGKKTLLLEFDLRNPKLAEYLQLQKTKGLSSYLINDARLEDIIFKTGVKHLDAICAGEIPPNPVELVASENTRNLIEIVQNIYDYIIIDTPPIGVVTYSYLLMDHSDVNLFVVRLNYTNKKFFASLIKDIESKEISNIAILINDDVEKTSSVYYGDSVEKGSYIIEKLHSVKSIFQKEKEKQV